MTNQQRSQIKAMIQSSQWGVIEFLEQEIEKEIWQEGIIRSTQWETIKQAIRAESKVEGMREFIKRMYKEAQNDDI